MINKTQLQKDMEKIKKDTDRRYIEALQRLFAKYQHTFIRYQAISTAHMTLKEFKFYSHDKNSKPKEFVLKFTLISSFEDILIQLEKLLENENGWLK